MPSVKINDFSINVATVNGSGSASSNTILAKSIFRMGVPVAPKNLFPSNIAGLPTWFVIRVTGEGWQARTGSSQIVIAMNPATADDDIAAVEPGGALFIDEALPQAKDPGRDDIAVFTMPVAGIAKPKAPDPRLRKLIGNMVYVGVAAYMLDIDMDAVEAAVGEQFAAKQKVVDLNLGVIRDGWEYAKANFDRERCPFRVEPMDATDGKMFIEGNTAAALGALMGGASVVAWYPITPSSSLCEEFIRLADEHRVDEKTGEKRFADIQAEDEIAAIGLVMGAGWAGARAFTATAGPGVSLMSELAGFGYYAEVPGVIMVVQRVGPSTGMPTRTQQSDITLCRYLSHGDTEHILLLPSGPGELYEFAQQSFDLAERYQTPVFLMTDLDMGMNSWIAEPFTYPERPFDRGKLLDAEALKQASEFHRYADPDGDGVPYRTLPGTRHPLAPYFTRGSGHTTKASYTEDPDEYKEVLDRIKRKIDGSVAHTPEPVIEGEGEIGIVHYGSTSFAVDEARARLSAEGVETRSCRLRAVPLHDEVIDFVNDCRVVYVAEQNRDGQMADILRLKVPGSAKKISKVLYYAGLPIAADVIVDGVLAGEREPVHA